MLRQPLRVAPARVARRRTRASQVLRKFHLGLGIAFTINCDGNPSAGLAIRAAGRCRLLTAMPDMWLSERDRSSVTQGWFTASAAYASMWSRNLRSSANLLASAMRPENSFISDLDIGLNAFTQATFCRMKPSFGIPTTAADTGRLNVY